MSRTTTALLLAVAMSVPGTIAGAAQPTPPAPAANPYGQAPVLSIVARPNPVVFSHQTVVSGVLRSKRKGESIVLQARSYVPRGTFRTVATTTTVKQGRYAFTVKPRKNTVYRTMTATQPQGRSADLLVRVRMRVGVRVNRTIVRAGARVRFSGRVYPRHNGRRAFIQRRTAGGRWRTVARKRLRRASAGSSRYVRRVRVRRSGAYRVKVNGHGDHATGYSRTIRIVAR